MEKLTVVVKQLPANDIRCFISVDENKIIDTCDYVGVYKTTFDVEEQTEKLNLQICEDLFNQLNLRHPDNYAGRSMSVGDLVVIKNNDYSMISYYICNPFGFVKVRGC